MSRLPSPPGYRIEKEIGSGGFGIVYKATNSNGRVCALKAINIGGVHYKELARQEWKKEVYSLIQVGSHPSIVQLYSSFDDGDTLWVEMEYCSAGDLQIYFWDKGLSRSQKRQFMMEMASAVDHLHGNGIVHRDLKPENIMVTYNSSQKPITKLGDFGLAKAIATSSFGGNLNQYYMQSQCGTKYFMAPELFEGNQTKYTCKVDIFSLGTLFITLIRETSVGKYITNSCVDINGTVWPGGQYMFKTKSQLVLNHNAVVGAKLRELVNDMLHIDYHKRPTAKEVYICLRDSISPEDFDDRPRSRAASSAVSPP